MQAITVTNNCVSSRRQNEPLSLCSPVHSFATPRPTFRGPSCSVPTGGWFQLHHHCHAPTNGEQFSARQIRSRRGKILHPILDFRSMQTHPPPSATCFQCDLNPCIRRCLQPLRLPVWLVIAAPKYLSQGGKSSLHPQFL